MATIVSYLNIIGMFEAKNGDMYETFNGINKDTFTWKNYENTKLERNNHKILELMFDLSDATLLGSG